MIPLAALCVILTAGWFFIVSLCLDHRLAKQNKLLEGIKRLLENTP